SASSAAPTGDRIALSVELGGAVQLGPDDVRGHLVPDGRDQRVVDGLDVVAVDPDAERAGGIDVEFATMDGDVVHPPAVHAAAAVVVHSVAVSVGAVEQLRGHTLDQE